MFKFKFKNVKAFDKAHFHHLDKHLTSPQVKGFWSSAWEANVNFKKGSFIDGVQTLEILHEGMQRSASYLPSLAPWS